MIAVLILLIIVIVVLYLYYEPTIDFTFINENDKNSKIKVTLYYTVCSRDKYDSPVFERHSKLLFTF
jgi:hypothetical protein